jgi:hypothetical protein
VQQSDHGEDARDVQAMIDELAARSAELSRLLHDTVVMLNELLTERSVAAASHEFGTDGRAPLDGDVLEIARLRAQAAGIGVEDYLREAVLAHAARTHD